MAFPPEFSSTATYENRYDLNEIDVFLEGNFSNPMFFNISGIPQNLSFGKHYFNLSILDSSNQEYELRPNSKILFEFKSINNVILRSDVVELNQLNGVATCFVEVLEDPLRTYEEVKDGQGTLTIVGSLQDKTSTQNTTNLITKQGEFVNRRTGESIEEGVSYHIHPDNGPMEGGVHNPDIPGGQAGHDFFDRVGGNQMTTTNPIPEKFIGAMNYRCIFPINIAKNLLNADSPIVTNTTHKKTTLKGQFSFVKANISPLRTSDKGLTYTADGAPAGAVTPESQTENLN